MANPIDYYGDIMLHGGALKSAVLETVDALPESPFDKQIVVFDNKVHVRINGKWVILGSSADITTVQQALEALDARVDTLETEMDTAQTDITNLKNGKIDKTSIVKTLSGTSDEAVPSEKAVKKAIDDAVTNAYKFAGTVASKAELDSKDKVNGAIYNVTATFEFEGETFEAGTNVVYDEASARWEPLSGVMDTSKFQLVGNLQASLVADATGTKYPNVTAVNEGLALKADKSDTYTKKEVDDALKLKADNITIDGGTGGTYTKVTVNAHGQVTSGQAKIAVADISDFATTIASAEVAIAGKLKNAQNFSITGGAKASAVSFNGTDGVVLEVTELDGTKVSGLIPVASVPEIGISKITDFEAEVKNVIRPQFVDVALGGAGVTAQGNKYTITTQGKAYGVMVMNGGVQVFVSTTITDNTIVLDFNSAINASEFTVSYIQKF